MSRHHSIFTLAAGWLLTFSPAHAAEPLACENSLGLHLAENAVVTTQSDDATIEFEAGEIEGSLGSNTTATLKDGVLLRRGDKLVGAETVRYDPQQRALLLDGDVRYEDPATEITSDAAEFAYDSGQIQFSGAEFSLGDNNARGGAANILISQAGILRLNDVRYTTCPPGSNDWELQGSEISINTREGVGTARNMRLRFQGVPILWAPYISFPVGDARKSGILTPEIGSSGRSGNEIRVPYYWNIAPNYDATLTPRLLTSRGLQLQTEFRYLSKRNTGQVVVQYLNNDKLFDDTRQLLSVRHRTSFSNGWRGLLNFREVSDNQYFEDLGGSLSASSTTHLNRNLSFDWHTDTMSWLLKAQGFQTLDDAILPDQKPYRRLPQLAFSGYWPEHFAGLTTSLDAEVVNFDRDIGVTGWRANIAPRLELPIDGSGWFINPSLAWDYTQYDLDNVDPGFNDAPTRHVPISSLDTGLVFERLMNSSTQRIQTIEPRLLYVHIPFRQQDDLPVFDTIDPDLNLVQLFRTNRFLGVDRIGDTDQISVGVTSRILDVESGKELVTATVGQTRYLSDRRVTLPGGSPATLETSDYIAAVRFLLYENLNFDFGHQWGSGVNGTTQSEARLQYRPSTNKIVNIAYRYRRDSLEQGDLSWSWPLAKQWNFVGRYNYSFRDEAVLEQFFGLEYESCCWGLRLVSRRHISTRDGTRDSSFGLQLVLKGMTSVGTAADKLLERGILGYSADLR